MPRHDLDVVSLIAGLTFGGGALIVLADEARGWSGRWAWPILLITVGIAGLVATRARGGTMRE